MLWTKFEIWHWLEYMVGGGGLSLVLKKEDFHTNKNSHSLDKYSLNTYSVPTFILGADYQSKTETATTHWVTQNYTKDDEKKEKCNLDYSP